jgi:hypothetical protein
MLTHDSQVFLSGKDKEQNNKSRLKSNQISGDF